MCQKHTKTMVKMLKRGRVFKYATLPQMIGYVHKTVCTDRYEVCNIEKTGCNGTHPGDANRNPLRPPASVFVYGKSWAGLVKRLSLNNKRNWNW